LTSAGVIFAFICLRSASLRFASASRKAFGGFVGSSRQLFLLIEPHDKASSDAKELSDQPNRSFTSSLPGRGEPSE